MSNVIIFYRKLYFDIRRATFPSKLLQSWISKLSISILITDICHVLVNISICESAIQNMTRLVKMSDLIHFQNERSRRWRTHARFWAWHHKPDDVTFKIFAHVNEFRRFVKACPLMCIHWDTSLILFFCEKRKK